MVVSMKLARPSLKALAAAGATAAVIASGGAAYAVYGAASAPASLPSTDGVSPARSVTASQVAAAGGKAKANASTGTAAARAARRLGGLVIGELTSVSSTGGAASVGTISVRVPDGQTITAKLAKRTRIYAYQGPGTKPTTEALSGLRSDEMVAVRIVRRGTGTSASGTAGAGAVTLTAASPASGSGTAYAALIVDLGYAAGS